MREVLAELAFFGDLQADSVVTDPPYHLQSIVKRLGSANAAPITGGSDGRYARTANGFMGKQWDGGDIAFQPETWRLVYDVMKPGAHLLAFGGTRTFARMSVAIEDAGFEIRDTIMWVYGSGFPKSHDVSKGIDKAAGAEREVIGSKVGLPGYSMRANDTPDHRRNVLGVFDNAEVECAVTAPATDAARQWSGWGTALKPAVEPIILARKPLIGTVAANVLAHGTGALNIDGCRVPSEGGKHREGKPSQDRRYTSAGATNIAALPGPRGGDPAGRWPANLIHDGSDEVLAAFPAAPGQQGKASSNPDSPRTKSIYGELGRADDPMVPRGDTGSAARFFYSAKASKADRAGSKHPTVKPLALMRYLCRLVTPPGGTVLDPFAGSGTTLQAAVDEGFAAFGIEREDEYVTDIRKRMGAA